MGHGHARIGVGDDDTPAATSAENQSIDEQPISPLDIYDAVRFDAIDEDEQGAAGPRSLSDL